MECALPRNLVSVHSKRLTGNLSPLESALTENIGGSPSALSEELLERLRPLAPWASRPKNSAAVSFLSSQQQRQIPIPNAIEFSVAVDFENLGFLGK